MEVKHGSKTWTDEEDDYLAKRWAQGASAGVIARELNALFPVREKSIQSFSRNSVLGRAHRIKLKAGHVPKPPPRKYRHKPTTRSAPTLPATPATRATIEQEPRQPRVSRIPMPRLPASQSVARYHAPERYMAKGTCQYMPGVSHEKCGKPSRGPWCDDHRGLLIKPPEPAKERPRQSGIRRW